MASSFNTPYATLSFAHLFQPRPRAEGGEAVFSCSLLFDPAAQKSPAYKALQDACITVAREKFGANVNIGKLRMPFRDAGEKSDKYAGYNAGDTYINPWSKDKPGIVNAQRQDILLKEEVWAGQLVRANVTPFAYDTSGNKGVSFALNHVQIVRTDTARIDGRVAADKVFDDGEVDEYDGSSPF